MRFLKEGGAKGIYWAQSNLINALEKTKNKIDIAKNQINGMEEKLEAITMKGKKKRINSYVQALTPAWWYLEMDGAPGWD